MSKTTDSITEIASALEAFQQAMCQIAGPYADGEKRLIELAYGKTVNRKTTFSISPDDIEWARKFIEEMQEAATYLATELDDAMSQFEDAVEYAQEDEDE